MSRTFLSHKSKQVLLSQSPATPHVSSLQQEEDLSSSPLSPHLSSYPMHTPSSSHYQEISSSSDEEEEYDDKEEGIEEHQQQRPHACVSQRRNMSPYRSDMKTCTRFIADCNLRRPHIELLKEASFWLVINLLLKKQLEKELCTEVDSEENRTYDNLVEEMKISEEQEKEKNQEQQEDRQEKEQDDQQDQYQREEKATNEKQPKQSMHADEERLWDCLFALSSNYEGQKSQSGSTVVPETQFSNPATQQRDPLDNNQAGPSRAQKFETPSHNNKNDGSRNSPVQVEDVVKDLQKCCEEIESESQKEKNKNLVQQHNIDHLVELNKCLNVALIQMQMQRDEILKEKYDEIEMLKSTNKALESKCLTLTALLKLYKHEEDLKKNKKESSVIESVVHQTENEKEESYTESQIHDLTTRAKHDFEKHKHIVSGKRKISEEPVPPFGKSKLSQETVVGTETEKQIHEITQKFVAAFVPGKRLKQQLVDGNPVQSMKNANTGSAVAKKFKVSSDIVVSNATIQVLKCLTPASKTQFVGFLNTAHALFSTNPSYCKSLITPEESRSIAKGEAIGIETIDWYAAKIIQKYQQVVHSGSCFIYWTEFVKEANDCGQQEKKAMFDSLLKPNMIQHKYLLFPIWFKKRCTLLVLNCQKGKWSFFDPLKPSEHNQPYRCGPATEFQKSVNAYVQDHLTNLVSNSDARFRSGVRIEQNSPRQPTSSDSGIVVCYLMRQYVKNNLAEREFSDADCKKMRAEIIEELMEDWQKFDIPPGQ